MATAEDPTSNWLHFELVRGLVETGRCPDFQNLAGKFPLSRQLYDQLLSSLSEMHGVVLHPHVHEPWIIHPFSLTPSINWIEGRDRSWWAPCVWCALGVAALVGGELRLHTRFGAEGDPLILPVVDGDPVGFEDVLVHFAIPPARAWDNVHQHCSMVLPFHSVDDIDGWCERHGMPRGEAVPLHQTAVLARTWYGTHANADWRKWSMEEAQQIFATSGLTSDFWNLGARKGSF